MAQRKNRVLKPLTRARLDEIALRYVGRYAATRAMLERTLTNHLRRALLARQDIAANEVKKWIAEIVERHTQKGYVNDGAYAEMVKRDGRRSGWSSQKITQKLYVKGIKPGAIKDMLGETRDEDDMAAALVFIKKKHLGAWRKKETDPRKEMEKICRAGFSPDIARKLVKLSADQCKELLEELRTKYA